MVFSWLLDNGNHAERVVARYENGAVTIDTARVPDGNLPYETGVKDPAYYEGWVIVEAYLTRELAQEGHDRWVDRITGTTPPEKLTDCRNAMISTLIDDPLVYERRANV